MPSLSLKSISKSFGSTLVINNVTLDIADGEFFFLLGPSGCGKSTLLRIIAGLESPDSGDLLFDATSQLSIPANQRNIGMVFQQYALWPHMTVTQNVSFGLRVRNVANQLLTDKVAAALKTVRMSDFAERYPSQLSGGQQQRVALARALAFEPEIILLDEPLSNLDAKLRVEVRNEIREIRRTFKRTMVYVTHDQEDALKLADRVAIMDRGTIRQIGTPEDLYYRPKDLFVATFIGSANILPGVTTVREDKAVVEIDGDEGTRPTVETSPAGAQLAPQSKVVCVIRPEAFSLKDRELPGISATIIDVTFGGSNDIVQARLDSGQLVSAAIIRDRGPSASTGQKVLLHYDPASVLTFAQ